VTTKTPDGKPKCALQYYGVITNGTSENWNNVSMALSTAKPSLGGQPPKLPTCVIKFKDEMPVEERRAPNRSLQRRTSVYMIENESEQDLASPRKSGRQQSAEPAVQVLGTQVEKGMGSATYRIPRAATIEADNKPHKVSIIILDLNVALSYETVPVLAPHAYMKAVAKNNSDYQLLPGQMNVFLDNFFLAQSSLKHTNPSEDITLYLGVDEMIQVELKPQEQLAGKTGLIKKSKTQDYKNAIVIKNTKTVPIEIMAKDQLPTTTDERIKVKLHEPQLGKNNDVSTDENGHLIWKLRLEPGKEVRLYYYYTIEFPAEKDIVLLNQ
jgi:uncharacterized protein (TIGR02231 family)